MNRRRIGDLCECNAAGYLEERGYQILERNFRCRLGEIDIIAQKESMLVFVEVKGRTGDLYGRPAESVDSNKRYRVRETAKYYVSTRKPVYERAVFDVIEIYINHIRNAY